jgi:hypothetical protein
MAKGKQKYIETPERLLELFKDYKSFVKSNPTLKEDFVGKDAIHVHRQLENPLTWVGFEAYLCEKEIITHLSDYENNTDKKYTEYQPAIRQIKTIIQADQVQGGMVGIYQSNLTARIAGLADKQEIKHDIYDVKLNL